MAIGRLILLVSLLTLISTTSAFAKGVKYITPNEEKDTDCVPLDSSHPYQILSRRDKRQLERIIRSMPGEKLDPNLIKP